MKLVFVYNAKSGKINALIDVGHKLFSPKTYQCSLCALTYDIFSENKLWKNFRIKTDIEMEFFHIDEFEKQFQKTNYNYPIILSEENSELETFIDSDKLNQIENLESLIKIISDKLTL